MTQPVLSWALPLALAMLALAMVFTLVRLLRGPSAQDRVLALDCMYLNGMLLMLVLGMLYASNHYFEAALLVALCNYYHYHTQGFTTMMMGMRHIPASMEDATSVLGGGVVRVMRDVYLPAMRVTLISVAMFLFMRSMVTLSAVIFLVTPSLPLGAVTVMRLDEAGFTSQAAAFSTCIMGIVAIMALLLNLLTGKRR